MIAAAVLASVRLCWKYGTNIYLYSVFPVLGDNTVCYLYFTKMGAKGCWKLSNSFTDRISSMALYFLHLCCCPREGWSLAERNK